jgi:hypothetical protein
MLRLFLQSTPTHIYPFRDTLSESYCTRCAKLIIVHEPHLPPSMQGCVCMHCVRICLTVTRKHAPGSRSRGNSPETEVDLDGRGLSVAVESDPPAAGATRVSLGGIAPVVGLHDLRAQRAMLRGKPQTHPASFCMTTALLFPFGWRFIPAAVKRTKSPCWRHSPTASMPIMMSLPMPFRGGWGRSI